MIKVKKAIFPVAGFGTRFLPFTKAMPKEMLPIVDKPVIQILVEEAVASGIEQIIIITGRGKRAIEDHFDASFELEFLLNKKGKKEQLKEIKKIENLAKFVFIRQDQPRGDGHAILCAKEVVGNEPFAVMFGDDIIKSKQPALSQLIEVFEKHQNCVIGVQKVEKKDISKFGIVKPKSKGDVFEIADMVEKPRPEEAPSDLAIVGKFVCIPEIFEAIESAQKSKDGEMRLIDGFKNLIQRRVILGRVIKGQRFDTGDKLGFLQATVDAALSSDEVKDDFRKYLQSRM